jgi:hypothetical protein
VLEAGKLGQGHNDAFKKVTAPTSVAVVSMKQGFSPSPAVNPRDHQIRRKEPPLAYRRQEVSWNLSFVEQEVLPTGPPWPSQLNWTMEVQAATTPSGISQQAPPSTSLGSEEEAPQAGRQPWMLRLHDAFPRQRWSCGPLGSSRPRSGPEAKRRHQHPSAPRAAACHRAPSAPPTRLLRVAEEPSSMSCCR